MCGVFGYVGRDADVGGAILQALQTLEYRGYDSWGLAVATADGLVVDKAVGRINGFDRRYPVARFGIGHTRWATHGGVTTANSHPHLDCSQRLAVVHNGIIENHNELREELRVSGHEFVSETDSEVAAHLIEASLASGAAFREAVAEVFGRLQGYNALVVMDLRGQQFAAAKNVSPLVIGRGEGVATVASDAIALHHFAEELIYLDDDQIAILADDRIEILNRESLQPAVPYAVAGGSSPSTIALGAYPDFLSKEVAEQPAALRGLLSTARDEVTDLARCVAAADRVVLVGCGTASHAALAGSYFFSTFAGRDVSAIPASEFRYRAGSLGPETLLIALSQSGETIDVLEAVRHAQSYGCEVAAIVNTPSSTLDRAVRHRLLLRAGIEQCVLATKSYTAMLAALLLISGELAGEHEIATESVARAASAVEAFLLRDDARTCAKIGIRLAAHRHAFVIGRGVHYASALEAALKIKEVSYVHAEGFAGGELKHGVIALVEPGTPCLVVAPDDETRVDVLSGAAELRSRGGWMIGIGSTADSVFDDFITVADCGLATTIAEAVPGQLLAYHAALTLGHDPDRPRNLAKSVTVK
jgi:glucosamine--fructose-6-phosphate aminotransferase (isomerizing)